MISDFEVDLFIICTPRNPQTCPRVLASTVVDGWNFDGWNKEGTFGEGKTAIIDGWGNMDRLPHVVWDVFLQDPLWI